MERKTMCESETDDEKSIDLENRADRLQILGVDGEGYTHVHDADERRVYVLNDPAHETTTEGIVVRRHVRGHLDDTQPVERGKFEKYRRFVREHRGRWQEWRVVDLSPVGRAADRVTGGC
jgi:hypothetical protein